MDLKLTWKYKLGKKFGAEILREVYIAPTCTFPSPWGG